MRKFRDKKLLIASHNAGKVREITELLLPFGLEIISAADLKIEEPEENESTFEGNARLKALYCAKASQLPSLADDSGLVVPALNGQPGVYSARWAGPEKDFNMAMQRLESELSGQSNRSAYFICTLALAWPDGYVEIFEGRWDGMLTFPARGANGFGYDPIFIPNGCQVTAAEMMPQEKRKQSHRAKAFKKLVDKCFG
jgi:XTP/dITP diphosphohydrolase